VARTIPAPEAGKGTSDTPVAAGVPLGADLAPELHPIEAALGPALANVGQVRVHRREILWQGSMAGKRVDAEIAGHGLAVHV